jgi:hypothetical protein
MDIFYKDSVAAGALKVVALPPIRGSAKLLVFNNVGSKSRTVIDGVLITNIAYSQRTNTQFQQSLENIIYAYSFGDQPGDLTISGFAFFRTCDSGNGISNLLKFYKDKRISNNFDKITVTLADEVINGYLIAMTLNTSDPSAGIHSFSLLLKTLPAAFR